MATDPPTDRPTAGRGDSSGHFRAPPSLPPSPLRHRRSVGRSQATAPVATEPRPLKGESQPTAASSEPKGNDGKEGRKEGRLAPQAPQRPVPGRPDRLASIMAAGALPPTTPEPRSPPSSQEGIPGPAPMEEFHYREEDLVLQGVEWPSVRNGLLHSPGGRGPSPFDRILQRGWKDRLRRGLFRYQLRELRTRVLPGPVGFVAQLNVERGLERRAPQEIQSVRQSFDPQQFNFTKIRPEEVLFCMARGRPGPGVPQRVLVVINVSPLEFGHVLLVPIPALALPQILTPEVLCFGLEAVLLSTHPGFRVGFNSLGAFASVNHLHLHGFYLNWELLVESAPCKPLLPESGLFLLQDFPAPGFLFYSEGGRQLEDLADQIVRVTNHLVKEEVAHNLFVTRGAAPEGPAHARTRPGIRIVVWPRRACFGTKEKSAFNVALCELAGHLPIKTTQDFEDLTEASAIQAVQKHLLSDAEFAQLQSELVALLREQ